MPLPSARGATVALIYRALQDGSARAVYWLQRLQPYSRWVFRGDAHLSVTAQIIARRAEAGQSTDELILLDELTSAGRCAGDDTFRDYAPTLQDVIGADHSAALLDDDEYATRIIQAAKSVYALQELPSFIGSVYATSSGELNASLSGLQLGLGVFDDLLADATGGSRFRLLTLNDLRKRDRAPLIIPEVRLRQQQLMLLFAKENTGKSAWLLLKLAETAASGQHIIYVCGEGLGGILNRLEAIIAAHRLDAEMIESHFHIIGEAPQFAAPEQIDEAIQQALAIDEPITVVALDTLATATEGQNENAPEVMSAATGGMRRLMRALDCAGILVHHTGKDATRGARGHSSLGGTVDLSVEITREDDSQVIVLRSAKARDTERFAPLAYELRPIALNEHADETAIVAFPGAETPAPQATPKSRLTASDRKALDALQGMSSGMRYGAWISQMWEIHQIPEATAKAAIRRLVGAGLVGKDENGMYHVLAQEVA